MHARMHTRPPAHTANIWHRRVRRPAVVVVQSWAWFISEPEPGKQAYFWMNANGPINTFAE